MKPSIAFTLAVLALRAPAFAQDSELISTAENGAAASGASELPALSPDGRYVAFESTADDLVAGDLNAARDVFVRDRYSETTELVSVDSFGNAANGPSERAALSGDGALVAFVSSATNLVANDANQHADIFVHDRASGVTRRVSISSAAAEANGPSTNPAFSGNGRYVAFQSTASNLVAADTNGTGDVFVHDLFTGATQRISVATSGAQANGPSEWPSLSHDGRYVAFASRAANLTGTGLWQVFRHDRTANVTQAAQDGASYPGMVGDSRFPSITSDGNKVTFQSTSSTLVPNDLNGHQDVFIHTFSDPNTSRISIGPAFTEANGPSFLSRISPDGNHVSFKSQATNLVSGDKNGVEDVFLSNLGPSGMLLISVGDGAQLGNGHASRPSISLGGAAVAFQSSASNLTPSDVNSSPDVYMWLRAPITFWVDGNGFGGDGSAANPFDKIQKALSSPAVFQGDTVNILSGTYVENLDLGGKGISLIGVQGADTTIIDGNLQGPVVTLAQSENPVLLKGLTLTRGSGNDHGFYGDGGGVYCAGCTLNIQDCLIVDNGGYPAGPERGGGVFAVDAVLSIEDTQIARNQILDGDEPYGGGLYCRDSTLSVSNSQIEHHPYARKGAGAYLERTDSQWVGSSITGNFPGGDIQGKGIYCDGPASLTLNSCVIEGHGIYGGIMEDGGSGGGVWARGVDVIATDCAFSLNSAGSGGGGGILLLDGSTAHIQSCVFTSNAGSPGGAISTRDSTTYVANSSFVQNAGDSGGSGDGGGAIHAWSGALVVEGCQFEDNATTFECYRGGAISALDMLVSDSLFARNHSAEGGAVFGSGVLTSNVFVDNDTYECPYGSGDGGAVHFWGGTISQCLFVGNAALGGYGDSRQGGAVAAHGPTIVDRCTIVGNTADGDGGGVWGATVANSILRDNYPDDLNGGATATWSIVDEPGSPGLGNLDVDPKFASDYHLMPHSPAVDAGDPAAPLDPDGSRADMGAFPYFHGTAVFYCTAKQTSGGCLPAVGSSGNLSFSGPVDFHVTASQVPNLKPGMLVWGSQQGAIPLGGGILCMAPPIARTPIQFSNGSAAGNDCTGVFDYLMTPSYLQGFLLQPGQAIFAQYWFRDPGFAPPNNTGLSNALAVGIAP